MTAESYPSGRVLTTSYDAAGRPTNVGGVLGSHAKNYAGATYAPQGAVNGLFYSNNIVPVYTYNSRLQLSSVYTTIANNPYSYLQVLNYNWGGSNNNGTLQSATIATGTVLPSPSLSTVTETYGYDAVNRLTSVTDTGGVGGNSRSFSYDSYGNMAAPGNRGFPLNGQTPASLGSFNAANQLTSVAYDAAGNRLGLPTICSNCLSYDAENRQTGYILGNAADGTAYQYDANGNRVEKADSASIDVYVCVCIRCVRATGGAVLERVAVAVAVSDVFSDVGRVREYAHGDG